jgi:uncharacterized protein (DUF302 family)
MIRHIQGRRPSAFFSILAVATALFGLAIPGSLAARTGAPSVRDSDEDHRVYLLLAENVPGSFDQVVQRLVDQVDESGWEIVGRVDAGTDYDGCEYKAHVLILHSLDYAATVLQAGLRGAFAVPIRVAVFEDEGGIHVGATNPLSLNRTMVAEEGMQEEWLAVAEDLRALGAAAFPEAVSTAEYGQKRDKGRIGRTMGIMAGGPFDEKITEVVRMPRTDEFGLSQVAARLMDGMGAIPGDWEWQLAPVFAIDLQEQGFAVLGVAGAEVERRSFKIVGKGGDDRRKDYRWPGVNHAPAYPVEVVIAEEGEEIAVYVVNEMFRMKMYFENAGKMAFARNMGMPGSIEDELKDKIRASLN